VKKATITFFFILIIPMLIIITIPFSVRAESVENAKFTIDQVNHTIKLMYDGNIFINDTVKIIGPEPDLTATLPHFFLGFPYKYGSYMLRCVAYNTSNVNQNFPVKLNVPLEDRVGFYGVEIIFPQALNMSDGATHFFTIGFVLSNELLVQYPETSSYTLDFPVYPSLAKTARICNASIVLPSGAQYVSGSVEAFTYSKDNLPEFTYSPGNVTFSLEGDRIRIVNIKELKREIRINGIDEIGVSDGYFITNRAPTEASSIEIILPHSASSLSARDQFGRQMPQPMLTDAETNIYEITFPLPLKTNESNRFAIDYYLPWEIYVNQTGSNNFNLIFPLFENIDYYIESSSITFVLPEGARMVDFEAASYISSSNNLVRDVFQETVTINSHDVTALNNFDVRIAYEYDILWASFRPTLWIWSLAIIGCAVAVVWKRPKAPVPVAVPTVAVRLRPESIKAFMDAYEEKRKIILEIESLETRVRKGKIPRRRYKVRKRTLDIRLDALSRDLAELKEKMRATGGRYADLMRQLEVAETEISGTEANVQSIEARHRRGELSLEAYRKLSADYQRRKEKAKTAIDGILLRLREEIR